MLKELKILEKEKDKWRPPSLSELTQIIRNLQLTHLGLKASKCNIKVIWMSKKA